MKSNVVEVLTIIIATALVDLGLILVFFDSSFRGYMPTIQNISFLLIFIYPTVVLVSLLIGQFNKILIVISWSLAALSILYLAVIYRGRMLTDLYLMLDTLGFCLTSFLLGRLMFKKEVATISGQLADKRDAIEKITDD